MCDKTNIWFEHGIRKSAKTEKAVMIILEIHDGFPVDVYEIKLTDNLTDARKGKYRIYVTYLN